MGPGPVELTSFRTACLQDIFSRPSILSGGVPASIPPEDFPHYLYLRKPVLSIPVEHQFEQVLNAIYLKRLGYGMNARKANRRILEEFIEKIPAFTKRLKSYPQYSNELFFNKLDKKIEMILKKR